MASCESDCKKWSVPQTSNASWRICLALLPALIPLILFAGFYFPDDPDLGYHLNIGSDILDFQQFPSVDRYRVDSDSPEIAYSWLPDVALELSHRAAGVLGLKLWVASSVALLCFIVIGLLAGRLPLHLLAVALLISSVCLFQVVGPRPRLWSMLCFGTFLLTMRNYIESKLSRNMTSMTAALAVVVIWANSHLSVVVAPVVAAVLLGARALEFRSLQGLLKDVILILGILIALLCNPYGASIVELAIGFSPSGQGSIAPYIVELLGFFGLPNPKPVWFWAGLLLLLCVVVFLVKELPALKTRDNHGQGLLGPLLVAIVFAILTFLSSRHFGFFVLAALSLFGYSFRGLPRFPNMASLVGGFLALLGFVVGFQQSHPAQHWYEKNISGVYPVEALEALREDLARPLEGNERRTVLTPFANGHFTSWWLRKNKLLVNAGVFLDGRSDELGRSRFLGVYNLYKGESYPEFLDQQSIDFILVPSESDLMDLLSSDTNWTSVGGKQLIAFRRTAALD
jgi:hypothetical protein